MSTKAQSFVGLTILSGVCLVVYCLAGEARSVPSSAYLVSILLALVASTLKVHLPGITGTISVNFLFILVAIAVFTFSETVNTAIAIRINRKFTDIVPVIPGRRTFSVEATR